MDVPNASVMAIEQAERFGLAQLHQLRGRVGRGAAQSYCILVTEKMSDMARARIRALVESTDGFYISEMDLKLRGPGEFFGTRQSGLPSLRVANILRDGEILEIARREAVASSPIRRTRKISAAQWPISATIGSAASGRCHASHAGAPARDALQHPGAANRRREVSGRIRRNGGGRH